MTFLKGETKRMESTLVTAGGYKKVTYLTTNIHRKGIFGAMEAFSILNVIGLHKYIGMEIHRTVHKK